MPAGNIINKVRSAFRRDSSDQGFSDTTRFDLSDELEEEETPKFNRLKVVVSGGGDMNGGVAGPGGGGGGGGGSSVNTLLVEADDDSLIDSSPGPDGSGLNMDPCDSCSRKRDLIKQKKVMKRLVVAVVLYTLFMIAEIVGGYVSSSLAIMTDAVHLLTDVIGILFSLLALWLSSKPPTNRYTFGLDRLEVVAAVFSVALIYILTAILLFEAVQRTIHQDFEIDGDVMLITAAVGVAVNLVMGFLLNQDGHLHSHGPGGGHGHSHGPTHGSSHGHGHGHGHGHSNGQDHGHSHGSGAHSGSEVVQQKQTGSLAVRAAFIHALGDLVQSVGVLVAAYIVRFKPEYKMADPICTYIFSILVLFTTFRIIRDTFVIVLEGAPKHLDTQMIRDDLLNLDDVQSVEELNVWALTGDKSAALVHLQLAPSSDQNWEEVQAKARHLLLRTYKVTRCTVQVQTHRQRQVRACANCQVPNA